MLTMLRSRLSSGTCTSSLETLPAAWLARGLHDCPGAGCCRTHQGDADFARSPCCSQLGRKQHCPVGQRTPSIYGAVVPAQHLRRGTVI